MEHSTSGLVGFIHQILVTVKESLRQLIVSILWLTKKEPKIYIDRVSQPYKNPTDRRMKKLIESGRTGTNLYNWWEINLVKNVSKDKELYVNQIPREVFKKVNISND